ncbi:hypothetical protein FA15DRAFT_592251 [Coprinopsis marcescibilis]|uniref:Yeast cell wall synthesis Kre9/Knh1-like N-terminal domain-containing protein n=1 Tax=Coprinopsis marcescibilis TaxID=230819 RepID=A0A5C3KWC7_COPMA|nr:hypothetical protein FA15DRAFT_592251 [Coprinopsis marcescibilis]
MFSKTSAFTTLALALVTPLFVRAVVTPNEPGPDSSYTAGGTCSIVWAGDADSDTLWADMSIQLMTGNNFEMVHITTVATGQDGTVDGSFTYTCPEVDPYSAIYFYQFTNPITDEKTWTTRFTITSPEGDTVEPQEAVQPRTGDAIPWGVGALANPEGAIPPPVIGGASTGSGTGASDVVSTPTARPTASSAPTRLETSVRPTNTNSGAGSRPSTSGSRPSGPQTTGGPGSGAGALKASSVLAGLVVSAMSLFAFA